jgi:hypothetical protein
LKRGCGSADIVGSDRRDALGGCCSDIPVTEHDHLRIGLRRITTDEVAQVVGVLGHNREVRRGTASLVRRAYQDFGCAQFIGHDGENIGQAISSRGGCHTGGVNFLLGPVVQSADGHGITVVIVTFPEAEGNTDLFDVADAIDALCLPLGCGECRQQQGGQNGDNGDHDEQLDQREGFFLSHNSFHTISGFLIFVLLDDNPSKSFNSHALSTLSEMTSKQCQCQPIFHAKCQQNRRLIRGRGRFA